MGIDVVQWETKALKFFIKLYSWEESLKQKKNTTHWSYKLVTHLLSCPYLNDNIAFVKTFRTNSLVLRDKNL